MKHPERPIFMIYALTEPDGKTIRYVGKTKDLKGRLRRHERESIRGRKLHKCNWIKGLLSKSLMFGHIILESELTNQEANEREQIHIQRLKNEGANLTNQTDGGGGAAGYKHSVATIKKLKKLGALYKQGILYKHDDEMKAKLSRLKKEFYASNGSYEEIRLFKSKHLDWSNRRIAKALGTNAMKVGRALKIRT